MSTEEQLAERRAALSPAKLALLKKRLCGEKTSKKSNSISPRNSLEPVVLSYAQQRLWFLDQLVPGNPFYNIPSVLPLKVKLNIDAFERCIGEIIKRHEVLRTTFSMSDAGPVQVVAPHLEIPLPLIDLRDLAVNDRHNEVVRIATEEARAPFNLELGPLLRTKLLLLAEDDYVLVLIMHHIVSDGWSMGLLFRELMLLYEAFVKGEASPLEPLPIQYADFALWQRQWLKGERLEEQLSYWKERLTDLPVLNLPTDHVRPAIASYKGALHYMAISQQLTERVKQLGNNHGCTLFQVLLTVFKILLIRYTGQTDIVVGAPIANRNRAEIEQLIGFFVNSFVVRTDLSGDPNFIDALKRVQQETLNAYTHQDLPFEKLVEELHPERDMSRNPLYQVTFQIQNAPGATKEIPTGNEERIDVDRGISIFDIAFSVWETHNGLIGGFEYSTDLFEADTIAQMVRHFNFLLADIVDNPQRTLSQYKMFSGHERQELLTCWNDTAEPYQDDVCLHQLVESQAHRTPDRIAIIFKDEKITYAELDRRANKLAHYLQKKGVKANSIVALCMLRSFEMVLAILATLKAGGAYLPLDPALPPYRLKAIIDDSNAIMILTQSSLNNNLEISIPMVQLDDSWPQIENESSVLLQTKINAEDLAYVIYTSGTTGKPKGVLIPHRAICNHMLWMQNSLPLKPEDRVLQRTPYYFDASVWEFFAPLQVGASLIIMPPVEAADTGALLKVIRENEITVMQMVPSLLHMMLEESEVSSCTSLRRVFCGGEPLYTQLCTRFFEIFDAELYNLYGPTETTIDAAYWQCQKGQQALQVPIGKPISNVQLYVLDQFMEPMPTGVIGEIYLGGKALAKGYLNDQQLTLKKFIADPFNSLPGARLYRTGDLGYYLRNGAIVCTGRTDKQVKLRGNRIELGEIEQSLSEHAAIDRAVVVVRGDQPGLETIVAYVTRDETYQAETTQENIKQLQSEHVVGWQGIYEEVYAETSNEMAASFDITGWNSSYTGEPIPGNEMQRWLDNTVTRILSLNPKRVLEIGCGTGLILFRVAPECNRYFALDFSRMALRSLRAALSELDTELSQVTLAQRKADDLSWMQSGTFDTVIINSVAQYFPSLDYLLNVLQQSSKLLSRGGKIFLGDLRSHPLLDTFHTSLAIYHADPDVLIEELQEQLCKSIEQEKELLIDPLFFKTIGQRISRICGVEISLKRGTDDNELVNYRYDVTLWLDKEGSSQTTDLSQIEWQDWQRSAMSVEQLSRDLKNQQQDIAAFSGIPNKRVSRHIKAYRQMREMDAESTLADLEILLDIDINSALEPEAFNTSDFDAYEIKALWCESTEQGTFDIICRRKKSSFSWKEIASIIAEQGRIQTMLPLAMYATNPLLSRLGEHLIPIFHDYLAQRLPEYMIPARINLLTDIPLQRNGKIDYAALPEYEQSRPAQSGKFVAPDTSLQHLLVNIWGQVLRIKQIGIDDDFFKELGGHSLLATQLMSRIRETFQTDYPLRLLFEYSTIRTFAKAMQADPENGGKVERMAQLILELDEMSDEQLETMYAASVRS